MSKNEATSMKLEVYKDKTSGKLSIMAHFSFNASNIFKEKDYYFWIPSQEEKDILDEAFDLFSLAPSFNKTSTSPNTYEDELKDNKFDKQIDETTEPQTIQKEKMEMPEMNNFNQDNIDNEIKEDDKTNIQDIKPNPPKENKEDIPPIEKDLETSDVFEITEEESNNQDVKDIINKKIDEIPNKEENNDSKDKSDKTDKDNKKDDDEGIIVEADSEAIEAALKKHSDQDDSIVEADEKTIIDRVLNQKKKGKWSKK